MDMAFEEAEKAASNGEIPVGCVIVDPDGNILAKSHNMTEELSNPMAHAEILALDNAIKTFGNKYLTNCSMYVTLEPCAMCAQALSYARIQKVYFGAEDEKFGAIEHGCKLFSNNKS